MNSLKTRTGKRLVFSEDAGVSLPTSFYLREVQIARGVCTWLRCNDPSAGSPT
jgi:hypothetical protein